MTEYLTEQEQIELIKSWVKQYSGVILGGVVLAVVIMTGWRYWQEHQSKIQTQASYMYDELLAVRGQNNVQGTLTQANKLYAAYPQTPYGQIAAFMIAREAISRKDYHTAEMKLNYVIDNSKINAFKQIARLRLARVMLAEKKPDETLKLLDTVNDAAFNGLIDEVRGDAYVAQKNNASARDAYKRALAELPNAETVRPLLQIKYDNISL